MGMHKCVNASACTRVSAYTQGRGCVPARMPASLAAMIQGYDIFPRGGTHGCERARAHTHTMQHTHLCAQMTLTLKIFNNRRPPQPDVPRDFPLLRSPLLPPLFCLPHFFREGAPPPHPAQHRLCMRLRVCMYVHMRTRSVAGIHSPPLIRPPTHRRSVVDTHRRRHWHRRTGTDTQAHRKQAQAHRHTDTQAH